ncbi:MAG: hypothetical protein KGS00_13300 [Alphaproteobacteria bacterium]|nr:hypothetical protein [Alphaproteobacteria bacterium]
MKRMLKGGLRVGLGVMGALGCLIALRAWSDPGLVGAQLGLSPVGGLGEATIRADIAGFFAGGGLLSIMAALRDDARLLTPPLLLVAIALSGRALTLVLNGLEPAMAPPMIIEAGLLAILLLGRLTLSRS